MATFKFGPADSRFEVGDFAFWENGADANNSLTLAEGGFLIATSKLVGFSIVGHEAISVGSRNWTMTLNGQVIATTPGKPAVFLWSDAATSLSNVTVGAEGAVSGTSGILSQHRMNVVNNGEVHASGDTDSAAIGYFGTADGDSKIDNSGLIESSAYAIRYSDDVTGTHTITNKGTIRAPNAVHVDNEAFASVEKLTNSGLIDGAVNLAGGNDSLINSGTITGKVNLRLGADFLQNSGTIGDDVYLGTTNHEAENDILINTGTIDGAVFCEGGVDTITNAGTLKSVHFTDGGDTFTNSGTLLSALTFGGGTLKNSGTIKGGVTAFGEADDITNGGTIEGNVDLGAGANKLTNSGKITGQLVAGAGDDTITNTGTIESSTTLGDGKNTLINSGTTGYISGGTGDDTVKSTGKINGLVTLGAGNDYFSGGTGSDSVRNGDGADTYLLGGGDDWYSAYAFMGTGAEATDFIDAGAGRDSYDVDQGKFASLFINIDTALHSYADQPSIAANTAYGAAVSGDASGTVSKDTLKGFENVYGSDQADVVYGNALANTFWGRQGADYLIGYAGNDEISGNEGDDHISGGLGADTLTGGLGADTFHFDTFKDSGITKATRDTISDFEAGVDKIDLRLLDGNASLAGQQLIEWKGTNVSFTRRAGEMRAYWTATGQMIEADFTGDGKADFSINLANLSHTAVLGFGDFIFAPLA